MPSLARNKKATFDYEFLKTYEGGLVLSGAEVKSIKAGHVKLAGAFLHLSKGELWLKNAHVSKYGPAGPQPEYVPDRSRKVLVHKKELNELIGKTKQTGLTLVPVSIYTKKNLIKVEFALARGKAKYEKRDAIKKRELDRKIREHLKE